MPADPPPLGGAGKVPGPCAGDPTHCSPQSSSLCLWGISLVLCVAETVFAVRCAQFSHQLLGLRPWCGKSYPLSVRPGPPYSPKSLISLEARLLPTFWTGPPYCRWNNNFPTRTKGQCVVRRRFLASQRATVSPGAIQFKEVAREIRAQIGGTPIG